jgi:UDP-glucose 4-epimerase
VDNRTFNQTSSRKALVTGAAGFIGRHVAQACLDLGMEVTALDDCSGGFVENVPAGARFVEGSILDDALVRSLTERECFDYVFHLAAYAAEGLSHFIRRYNYTNNVIGSVNLINAAIRTKVRCFVFTSSIAVYGRNQLPMSETMLPQPEDPYGVSKYAVELDLRAAYEMFGLKYIVFRPHNVYGEHQNIADTYRNVVGIFMNQIVRGQPMTVFGDGRQTRAFSYVSDVAPVIAASVLNEKCANQVFNIGADLPCTVLELAQEVSRAFGVAPEIRHLAARNEVVDAYASHEKLRNFFDGTLPAPTPLREGIAKMAAWVRQTGWRKPIEFSEIEITENLPPSWRR